MKSRLNIRAMLWFIAELALVPLLTGGTSAQADGTNYTVHENETLILPYADVSRLSTSDATIVYAQLLSDARVSITGKKAGTTQLDIGTGGKTTTVQVTVVPAATPAAPVAASAAPANAPTAATTPSETTASTTAPAAAPVPTADGQTSNDLQDGQTLQLSTSQPLLLPFEGLTTITICDQNIAQATITDDNKLAIIGRNPGETSLELTRGDKVTKVTLHVTDGTAAPAAPATSSTAAPAAVPATSTTPASAATKEMAEQSVPATTTPTTSSTAAPAAVPAAPATPAPAATTATTEPAAPAPAAQTTASNNTPPAAAKPSGADQPVLQPVTETATVPAAPTAGEKPTMWVRLSAQAADVSGVITYTAEYGNRGPGAVSNVTIRDILPGELTYVDGSGSDSASYSPAGRELTWHADSLAANAGGKVTFQAKLTDNTSSAGPVSNVVTIECRELDSLVASNTAKFQIQPNTLVAIFSVPDVFLTRYGSIPAFKDVTNGSQDTVARLEGLKIISGYPDGTFHPSEAVTRAESVKMVVLGANLRKLKDEVRLTYVLTRDATLTLTVLDDNGATVRTLINEEQKPAGDHSLTWDGRDDAGKFVPPGKYTYCVSAVAADGTKTKLCSTIEVIPVQKPEVKGVPTFRDVKPTDWYAGYVAEAENRQYVRGYPDGTFKAKRFLSRVEATAMVVRALGMEADAEKKIGTDSGFLDENEIPKWASGYVAVASTAAPKAHGQLIIGYPGNTFLPRQPIKRVEAAAIVERFIDRDVQQDTTVAGAIAPGATITINGKAISGDPHGNFRERIAVQPGAVNTIAVVMR